MHRRHVLKAMSAAGVLVGLGAPGFAARSSMQGFSATGGSALSGYLRTNWSRDRFAFGSYSYPARGSSRADVRALAEPVGDRLFFAGEATHPNYNGTVHAALESGWIAARRITDAAHNNIAVIGAGISGLAAARQLATQGIEVSVFEARDRIGGRIWTDDSLGLPLDLGASWIHGAQGNPLTELADGLALATTRTDEHYTIIGDGGRRLRDSDSPAWLDEVTDIQHNAGADADQLDLGAFLDQPDYTGAELIFPGGYAAILDAFEADYRLQLNATVSQLRHDRHGVDLALLNGHLAHFDAVLISVPLGVLKKEGLRFEPALPEAKRAAIRRLGMGALDKLYLQFDTAFWRTDATWILTPENGLPAGQFNQWLNLHRYLDRPVLMAFNGGRAALDLADLSDQQLVSRGLQSLRALHPA